MRTTKSDVGRGPRGGRLVAAAIVVVVAVGVGVAAVALREPAPDRAAVDDQGIPVVVHESVAALEAGDSEAWRALRSPDATLTDGRPVAEAAPLERFMSRQAELGLELSVVGCRDTSERNSELTTYECSLEGSESIMRAADLRGHATWTYVTDAGVIIESSPPFFDNGAEIQAVHGALARYLREVDRAAFEEVCNAGDLNLFDMQLGPDCTAFIAGHLPGFAKSQ